MRFLVLGHGDGDHAALAAVQRIGQGDCGLGLADAGGADQQEHALRLVRVFQVGARGAHALGDGVERVALADHPFLQRFLQLQHGLDFVGDHAPDRDAGPAGDDLRHRAGIHHRDDHRLEALQRLQFATQRIEGGHRVGTCRIVGGQRLDLVEFGVDLADQLLFLGEAGFVRGQGFAEFRGFVGDLAETLAVVAAARGFLVELRALGGEHVEAAPGILDPRRGGVLADRDLGAGGVEHADRLVRQLAAGDEARTQLHRFGDRLVEDAHLVVRGHRLADAAQHRYRFFVVRLVDLDHLEAAGEGGILLEVFLVFRPGGRRDRAHLAARQRRLQQVGGIVLAGRAAGADQGVRLVDEHDDRLRAGLHFLDHALQPVLEFALDRGAGLQQAEVERQQFHALQLRRHVVLRNAQGQALDHRGLADAGLAGEDRIVLPATGQHVDHQADFRIAAEHRVQLAFARALGEVDAVLVEVRGLARLAATRGRTGRCRIAASKHSR